MSGHQTHLSAFDRGRKAAKMLEGKTLDLKTLDLKALEVAAPAAVNPFAAGSVDHDNFERGRRFGLDQAEKDAAYWRERPDTSRPDLDEGEA